MVVGMKRACRAACSERATLSRTDIAESILGRYELAATSKLQSFKLQASSFKLQASSFKVQTLTNKCSPPFLPTMQYQATLTCLR